MSRLVTRKVELDSNKSLGYGYLLYCCGKHQPVNINEMESGNWWECVSCYKPLLLKRDEGFFEIGNNVTI